MKVQKVDNVGYYDRILLEYDKSPEMKNENKQSKSQSKGKDLNFLYKNKKKESQNILNSKSRNKIKGVSKFSQKNTPHFNNFKEV